MFLLDLLLGLTGEAHLNTPLMLPSSCMAKYIQSAKLNVSSGIFTIWIHEIIRIWGKLAELMSRKSWLLLFYFKLLEFLLTFSRILSDLI